MSTRLLLSQKGSEEKKKQNMAAEKGYEVWCVGELQRHGKEFV